MNYRALICDLDMTVIDSRRDIADAVAMVVREHNETVLDPAQIIPWIGRSLWKLFAGLVPGADPATVQQLVDRYKRHFYDHCADQTTIYPGVREVLALLGQRSLPRAIATTKMTFMAHRVCEVLGLVPYFEHIQGTDGFPEKPDPTVLLKTCEALAISPATWAEGGPDGPSSASACGSPYGSGGVPRQGVGGTAHRLNRLGEQDDCGVAEQPLPGDCR